MSLGLCTKSYSETINSCPTLPFGQKKGERIVYDRDDYEQALHLQTCTLKLEEQFKIEKQINSLLRQEGTELRIQLDLTNQVVQEMTEHNSALKELRSYDEQLFEEELKKKRMSKIKTGLVGGLVGTIVGVLATSITIIVVN
jgi:hypothetical protein